MIFCLTATRKKTFAFAVRLRTVAFSSIRDGTYEVYLMDLDGMDQRNLTGTAASTHERVPAWIDAQTVAYLRETRSARGAEWVVMRQPLDGEPTNLTNPGPVVSDFALSAAADMIALAVDAPGSSGGTLRQLYLTSLTDGTSIEVPRAGPKDQLIRPAFRP